VPIAVTKLPTDSRNDFTDKFPGLKSPALPRLLIFHCMPLLRHCCSSIF